MESPKEIKLKEIKLDRDKLSKLKFELHMNISDMSTLLGHIEELVLDLENELQRVNRKSKELYQAIEEFNTHEPTGTLTLTED